MVKGKVNRRDPGDTYSVGLDPDFTTSKLSFLSKNEITKPHDKNWM